MSGRRSNRYQIRMLVDYMSTNRHLATGEFTGPMGNKRALTHWAKLKEYLKSFGPDRTIEQWRQTWKDLKKTARNENARQRQAMLATGNRSTVPIVSEVSQQVLDIIGHSSSLGVGPEESSIGTMEIPPTRTPDHVMSLPPVLSAFPETSIPFLDYLGHDYIPDNRPQAGSPIRRQRQTPRRMVTKPYESFAQLQREQNDILRNIANVLTEKNALIKEQNKLLEEANKIASGR